MSIGISSLFTPLFQCLWECSLPVPEWERKEAVGKTAVGFLGLVMLPDGSQSELSNTEQLYHAFHLIFLISFFHNVINSDNFSFILMGTLLFYFASLPLLLLSLFSFPFPVHQIVEWLPWTRNCAWLWECSDEKGRWIWTLPSCGLHLRMRETEEEIDDR